MLGIFITHKNPPSSVGFEPTTGCPVGPVASTLTTRPPKAVLFNIYQKEERLVSHTLKAITKSSEDFLDTSVDKLSTLLQHSFINSQQSRFLNELESTIKLGECIVLCDFGKNHSFFQDEAPAYNWNNAYATILPFTIYFKDKFLCNYS
jgi:hypothetical protein